MLEYSDESPEKSADSTANSSLNIQGLELTPQPFVESFWIDGPKKNGARKSLDF
jgi:hypothetical protein